MASVFLVAALGVRAAFEEKPVSARLSALGEAGAGDAGAPDAWLANPAALRSLDRAWAVMGHTRLWGEGNLPLSSLAVAVPTERRGVFGASLIHFGNGLYAEREASLAHAFRPAPALSVGAGLTAYAVDVDRYGSSSAWGADVGLIGRPSPRTSLGFAVKRLNSPRLSGGEEAVPSQTRAGASVSLLRSTWLSAELAKSGGGPFAARIGVETFLATGLSLRAGGQSRPSRYAVGLGLLCPFGRVDYAFITHPFLGDQHLASLSFAWGRSRSGP